MDNIILGGTGKTLLVKLLSWMASRGLGRMVKILIPEQSIPENIEINIRNIKPVIFDIYTPIPVIRVYFRIINNNPFPVLLDRLLLDIWLGQPFVNGGIFHRLVLEPGSTVEDLMFCTELTEKQLSYLKTYVETNREVDGTIRIRINRIDAYGESAIGKFHKNNWVGSNLNQGEFPVSIRPL